MSVSVYMLDLKLLDSKKDYCSISVVATGIKEPKPPKPFVVPQGIQTPKPKVTAKATELKQAEKSYTISTTNTTAVMKTPIVSRTPDKTENQMRHKSLTIPDFLKYAQRDRK